MIRDVPIEPGRPTIILTLSTYRTRITKLYPWHVCVESTPRQPTLGAQAIAWATEMFGPPGNVHMPKKIVEVIDSDQVKFPRPIPFAYPTDHRWHVSHPNFYFRDRTDAAAFKLVWYE